MGVRTSLFKCELDKPFQEAKTRVQPLWVEYLSPAQFLKMLPAANNAYDGEFKDVCSKFEGFRLDRGSKREKSTNRPAETDEERRRRKRQKRLDLDDQLRSQH